VSLHAVPRRLRQVGRPWGRLLFLRENVGVQRLDKNKDFFCPKLMNGKPILLGT
jgi:hypothetical protein